jgi:hypothetical protein
LSLKTKVVEGFRFGPQNWQLPFGDLGLKIIAMVSWFGPQNEVCYSLSVAPENRWEEDGAGHTLRSSGLLRVEASGTTISQSDIKTGGRAMAGGACAIIVEVASNPS